MTDKNKIIETIKKRKMKTLTQINNYIEALEKVDEINQYNRQIIIDVLKWIRGGK